MSAVERTQQAEVARWVETQHTQHGPVHVIHVVHHVERQTTARDAERNAETTILRAGGAALAMLVLLSMFALAGQGSQATGLAVGIALGVAGAGALVGWLMIRQARR